MGRLEQNVAKTLLSSAKSANAFKCAPAGSISHMSDTILDEYEEGVEDE